MRIIDKAIKRIKLSFHNNTQQTSKINTLLPNNAKLQTLSMEADTIIFDTETTGNFSDQRIIEIGGLFPRKGVPIGEWQQLINPGVNITHFSQHLSGINDAMIANEPPASTVIPWFINSIQNLTIVGYNVNFDINALNEEANRLGMSGISVSNVIDVIDIARQSLPNSPSYSLEQVAILLNVSDTEKHRALDDAILTWKCWQKMESMNNKQIILSQEQVTTVSQRNSKIRNDKTKHVLLSRYLDNSSDPINQKPSGREIISYDRGENLTGWKNHQEILAHYGYDAWL